MTTYDTPLPPHDDGAERQVLGCILDGTGAALPSLNTALEWGCRPEWFYDLRHRTIWNAVVHLHEAGIPVETPSVMVRLRTAGTLEECGGVSYLAELPNGVISHTSLTHYLKVVWDKLKLRKLLGICARAADLAQSDPGDVDAFLAKHEAEVAELTETSQASTELPLREIVKGVVNDMESYHYKRGSQQLRGLPLGPPGWYLDKIIRGVRERHYLVVAGRPGDGKTSFALNVLEHLALEYVWQEVTEEKNADGAAVFRERKGIPIAVFSVEMDQESLGYRLLFGRAGVDTGTWSEGYAKKADHDNLVRASGELSHAEVWVDDTPSQSIGMIAAKARRMARQYGIKLFVLDYLQLVEMEDGRGFDRVKELTKISRKIMALKKQLGVPWMVLAQMNRNIETSEVKRTPVLSDLKDCGAIEQDADAVIFLHRASYEQLKRDEPSNPDGVSDQETVKRATEGWKWSEIPVRMNAFVAKNRFGPVGSAKLVFCPNFCRFDDWHLWKCAHAHEELKQGERARAILPRQTELGETT
jgi:replicative DNA helicase